MFPRTFFQQDRRFGSVVRRNKIKQARQTKTNLTAAQNVNEVAVFRLTRDLILNYTQINVVLFVLALK